MNRPFRSRAVFAALAILCAAALIVSIGIGTVKFTLPEILTALVRDDDSAARLLIWNLRLPRVLTGGLVGMCLALSGCILQSVMRSHLASPSTIGVTAGAGFLGHLTLCAFPAFAPMLPAGCILGALITTLLIWALACRGGTTPVRLILAGMAVSALLGAGTDLLRTLFADRLENAAGFLVGSLNGVGWRDFLALLPFAAVGILAASLLPRPMNLLALGDDVAASLGLRTGAFRLILIVIASLLAGAAISAAGMISFVGLIVPHIARLLVGSDCRRLLPASALLGFSLVTACDTVGRVILPPGEVPVSILLSLIGAPFFLWLLRSRESGVQ